MLSSLMNRPDYTYATANFEAFFQFGCCEIFVPRYRALRNAEQGRASVAKYGVLGISFDHMHMGDLLRQVHEHPDAEIAGIYDPDRKRMESAIRSFSIPQERVFTDLYACLTQTRADLAIVCSATAEHANSVERIAPHGLHVMIEKPFASNVADARRIMKAMAGTGKLLAVNWPLAWYPSHNTAKKLIDEGAIGEPTEVHFYDGNRGPLFHLADKIEVSPEEVEAQKPGSWWYKRASGGGSLLDYLGYGTTLGSWFLQGMEPLEVTSIVDETPGIEVDQHSITVCRYSRGLSKFETRWGTLTDPWTQQPQPKCGFVLVGTDGSISSYDYDDFVTLQTRSNTDHTRINADALPAGRRAVIEYMLARIEDGEPITGPLDPALSLLGQRMIDSAVQSSREKRAVQLVP
jgi:predicted dehydrogenase